MIERLDRSSAGRPARAVNPCDPSPRFVSSVVERIGTNPLNFRVLEAVASGVTVRDVATVIGIDRLPVLELVQDMKTAMRVRNSMAMVVFGLDNGLLDVDAMARKFDFDKYGSLLPKERKLVDILAAKGSWGKSDQELPSALGIVDMTSCREEINRLCLKLGVENLMQLRVYEYLRPKTLTKAEPNPDLSKSLSPEQIRVIEFKTRGLSDKEAGKQLEISGLTVRWYIKNAMEVSGQSSLIEMVADLIKRGVLNRRRLSEGLDFSRYQQLTEREREIFATVTDEANLCQSLENIAPKLQMLAASLNNYLVNMYAVLGVKDVWGLKIYGLLLPKGKRDVSPKKEEELGNEERTLRQKRTFTEREIEIVELIACGFLYKQVAEQLHISEHAAKNHVARITHRGGRPETPLEVILALMDEGMLDKGKLSEGLDFSNYEQLTKKEREALKVLADNPDLPQDGLAQKMVPVISPQTYKAHAAVIIHKLGVKSSIQAAVYYRLLPGEMKKEEVS